MILSTDSAAVAAARAQLDAIRRQEPAPNDPGMTEWTLEVGAAILALGEADRADHTRWIDPVALTGDATPTQVCS